MGGIGIDFGNIMRSGQRAAQGSAEQTVGGAFGEGANQAVQSVFESTSSVVDSVISGAADMGVPSAILNPAQRFFSGALSGAQGMGSNVTNMINNGYMPTPDDRLGNSQYFQYAGGRMVGVGGFAGDGSVGSVAASLGLFTYDEAQLFSLIQDPVQRQMFIIDKRMKQQSLLSSMLTNIMAAKQDVLKEMGRNLRT